MRLIDIDRLPLVEYEPNTVCNTVTTMAHNYMIQEIRGLLSTAPIVDAIPVVRCKDCIHYDLGVCLKIYSNGNVDKSAWQERKEDDFCSYGKRKQG